MTSSRQVKGRNLEYAVRRRLEALGFVVLRCAGSRPVDLVAIKEGRIILVECKAGKNPSLPPKQLNHVFELSKTCGADSVLVVRKRHREVRWFKIIEQGIEETGLKQLQQGSPKGSV